MQGLKNQGAGSLVYFFPQILCKGSMMLLKIPRKDTQFWSFIVFLLTSFWKNFPWGSFYTPLPILTPFPCAHFCFRRPISNEIKTNSRPVWHYFLKLFSQSWSRFFKKKLFQVLALIFFLLHFPMKEPEK